jgi:5-methylcytosine-specific restriction endonuclease McrA
MAKFGHIVTEETREKLRKANLGKKVRDDVKLKISKSLKGNSFAFGHKHSEETRKKMSKTHTGKKLSEKHRETLIGNKRRLGIKHTEETKLQMSKSRLGEKNGNWKNGITPINRAIRTSKEYKLWRTAVFERDNYTCIWCGLCGVKLNADHIKPFAHYPELRFAIDNGRTLCVDCHKTTDTYAGRIKVK